MKACGLLSEFANVNFDKCEVCFETKSTKKPCKSVSRDKTELLTHIHTDLGEFRSTMSRGGNFYYITFIDDFSRYTKVYLLRNKNKAGDMFLKYKSKVVNQLDRKLKRLRSDREANMNQILFRNFVNNMASFMRPPLHTLQNPME